MKQTEWNEEHSRKRLLERFGIPLDHEDYERICRAISMYGLRVYKDITIEPIGRISKRKSVHKITFKEYTPFFVLYSMPQHNIQTVYPKEHRFTKLKMFAIEHGRDYSDKPIPKD